MTELRCVVYGHAAPAGSKRAFAIKRAGVATGQVAVVDANPRAKSWQREVRDVVRETMEAQGQSMLTGPLELDLAFYVTRPKGHYGTGRNARIVKPAAPGFPTGRPDALKLARGTEDACTGLAWRDDAQVVDLRVRKLYGAPERCEIVIRPALSSPESLLLAEAVS